MSGVSSPDADGTYGTGRIVAITVVFSGAVAVEGEPRLELATDPTRYALYTGGSGTDALEFWYAVQPGDRAYDLGYADASALSAAGGSIAGIMGGAAADLELPDPGRPGSLSASANITVVGAPVPVLAASGSATNATSGFGGLARPVDVAVLELGGAVHAVAATKAGVQLVRIHENGTLEAGDLAADETRGFDELGGPSAVAAFEMGGAAHAVVASLGDDGVQLVRIHENGTLEAGGSATDGDPGFNLFTAYEIDTLEMNGAAHAIVASDAGDGVQLVRIHENGTLEARGWAADGERGFEELAGSTGVAAFEMNGAAHAVVASDWDDGVQLVRIHENGTLEARGWAADGANGFEHLNGARAVDTLETGGMTYALVASRVDSAVQLARIHENGTLEAGDSAADDTRGFDELDEAGAVDAFEMGGAAYAIVSSFFDDGVQLVRIHESGALQAVGSVSNGTSTGNATGDWIDWRGSPPGPDSGFVLGGPIGVDAFEMGGRAYALVASNADNGLQLIRMSPTRVAGVSAAVPDGAYAAGSVINVSVAFDGPVVVRGEPPSLTLSLDGASRTAAYASGNRTDAVVFAYEVGPGDAAAGLEYAGAGALATRGIVEGLAEAAAADLELPAPGAPGSLGASGSISIDTEAPAVLSVSSPDAAGTYGAGSPVNITVAFSENVVVAGGPPRLLLGMGEVERGAAYASGSGSNALTFRYVVEPGDASAALEYAGAAALSAGAGGAVRDAAGNDADLALPAPGAPGSLGASSDIAIDAPAAAAVDVGPGGPVGPADFAGSGDGLSIAINVSSLAADGAVSFPQERVAVAASFATITFPPGATAVPAPPGGILLLRVADDVPGAGEIASALAWEGSGPLALQRVVEVGGGQDRIEFDMPVRVLLAGQAGGRAFYAEGGGPVVPIDRACALDDADAVHRQLGGAGECQVDAGDDKAIHTYHLAARFGTARAEAGAPAPAQTCSARLGSAEMMLRADPGGASPPALQTIANSGSQTIRGVEIAATPWYVDPSGDPPYAAGQASLPASLTEAAGSDPGDSDAFAALPDDGAATPLPQAAGLGPGAESSVWLRINMAGQPQVEGATLVQYITYVVECGDN